MDSISYQFTQVFSFRFILTYYTSTKDVGIYPLISYELNLFTVFYIGANINALKYDEPFAIHGKDHQIFAKFQYSFKM